MATSKVETQPEVTPEVKHVGGGYYDVNGKRIQGKAKAEEYAANLRKAEETLAAPDLSDVLPPEFDIKRVRERIVTFRDNLRELPMNETHLPDGSINPMYDRMYYYAWASYSAKSSVADRLAKGYELVGEDDLEQLIKDGKCPDLYRHMLRAEGRYLVYGDDILIRMPRVLHRQLKAEKDRRALEVHRRVEERNQESFEQAGMKPAKSPVQNELQIRF